MPSLEPWGYNPIPLNSIDPLLGRPVTSKGDSFFVADGGEGLPVEKTASAQLAKALKAVSFVNQNVGGSTTQNLLARLLDIKHPEFYPGANKDRVIAVSAINNDILFNGGSQVGRDSLFNGLEALVCVLRSRKGLTNWKFTGSWSPLDGPFSSPTRQAFFTVGNGDSAEIEFVVDTGKGITALLVAQDIGTGADYTAFIDDVEIEQGTTTWQVKTDNIQLPIPVGFVPVSYSNANWVVGSKKKFKIQKRGGDFLVVNSLHQWVKDSPAVVFVPPLHQEPDIWATYDRSGTPIENRAIDKYFRHRFYEIIQEFGTATMRSIWPNAIDSRFSVGRPGLRRPDRVHPSIEGSTLIKDALLDGLRGAAPGVQLEDFDILTQSEFRAVVSDPDFPEDFVVINN